MNNDTDQIHTASGADMNINHISHAIVHAPGHNLDLMSHKHTKIWSLFIILPLKILPFLSFILTLSLSRTNTRGEFFWKADVKGVCILFLP